jgi:chromosome segregation ATPase
MSLGQWLSKLNPVQRSVDDAPTSAQSPASDAASNELKAALDQLRSRHADLSKQVDQLRAVAEVASRPVDVSDPRVIGLQQQVEGLRLQHDSLLAGLHEAASSSTAHATQLSSLVGRVEAVEHAVRTLGDPSALQQQLAGTQAGRLEIDNKFAEIQGNVRKLQTSMTSVLQSAEVAREAYLARDNARIAEVQHDRRALWAIVGITFVLSVVALLTALMAMRGPVQ